MVEKRNLFSKLKEFTSNVIDVLNNGKRVTGIFRDTVKAFDAG